MRNPDRVSYQPHPSHIDLTWPDGTTRSFLYVWLRDNCPTARHSNGQKNIETSSISLDIVPEHVSLNELGVLEVHWRGEDHISYFDVEVLRRRSEPPRKWTSIVPEPAVTWDGALDIDTLKIDYTDYIGDDSRLYKFLDSVVRIGFGVIKNAPPEITTVLNVVDRFGYVRRTNYGEVFHVKVNRNPENLANTSLPLSPHTDNPYRNPVPTLQLLHCLNSSMNGGETILVDGFKIAEHIYDNSIGYFNLLANTPITFRYRTERVWLEADTTFLGLDSQGLIRHIRVNNRSIRPFNTSMSRLADFYKAYFFLLNSIDSDRFQIRFKLEPGDVILFDNERVLHGRTGYEGEGDRHLVGCYSDRDGLLSKWRILRRNNEEKLANGYRFIH